MHDSNKNGKLIFGIAITAIGILLLLDSLNILYFDAVFDTWWPMIMIIPGIVLLLRKERSVVGGSILLIFGSYFQLRELHLVPYHFYRILFPLTLIAIGLILVLQSHRTKSSQSGTASDVIEVEAEDGDNAI